MLFTLLLCYLKCFIGTHFSIVCKKYVYTKMSVIVMEGCEVIEAFFIFIYLLNMLFKFKKFREHFFIELFTQTHTHTHTRSKHVMGIGG